MEPPIHIHRALVCIAAAAADVTATGREYTTTASAAAHSTTAAATQCVGLIAELNYRIYSIVLTVATGNILSDIYIHKQIGIKRKKIQNEKLGNIE